MKNILAVVMALIVGSFVIVLIERVGHSLYPIPESLDFRNKEAIRSYLNEAPIGSLLFVFFAWAGGALIGGLVSSYIATESPVKMALVSGGIFMVFGIVNMITIPNPFWMWSALLVFVPMSWLGSKVVMVTRKN